MGSDLGPVARASQPLWGQFRRTALHRASLEGHTEILEKLLESGATMDFQDRVSERAGIGGEEGKRWSYTNRPPLPDKGSQAGTQ